MMLRLGLSGRRMLVATGRFNRCLATGSGGSTKKDVTVPHIKGISEVEEAFDKDFVIPGPEGDRGMERIERETRAKMRRIPRHQGDFSSLEERHILYGAHGTIEKPVRVESIYPSRIVGCFGSDTHPHELLWHVVKRERPTCCLECGQIFELVLPPGETLQSRHHDAHH